MIEASQRPSVSLLPIAEAMRQWLFDAAAPMWAGNGRQPNGLFAERILLTGVPDDVPYRVFVQARHVYSFVEMGRLGWTGPWADLVTRTVDLLLRRARRADGFYVNSLTAAGDVHDERADLYVQAFVLFALARAGDALGRPDLFEEATRLTELLDAAWAHPQGGYREGEIVDASIRRQNPHMHLLEAFMALSEATGDGCFADAASRIASLCRDNFIDAETGALTEYFDQDWSPLAGSQGKIVEPGHCFEWAWLFERMAQTGWTDGARLSDGLTAFARRVGIASDRGVAVNEVLLSGAMHNGDARLWPQTERLKAAVARHARSVEHEAQHIAEAARGLERYLDVPVAGLWRDKLRVDGSWVDEPAPGSSFYHISCGYAELLHACATSRSIQASKGVK